MYSCKKRKEVPKDPIEIPSLIFLAAQAVRENIRVVLDRVGHVPDELLELLLPCCTPEQLNAIEGYAGRDVGSITEPLWRNHCRSVYGDDADVKLPNLTWKKLFQILTEQYEQKKQQTGKHLRQLYSAEAKEKASKKIKVLNAAPVSWATGGSRSSFGSSATPRPMTKLMGKCYAEMKKSMARSNTHVPPPTMVIPKVTIISPPKSANGIAQRQTTFQKKVLNNHTPVSQQKQAQQKVFTTEELSIQNVQQKPFNPPSTTKVNGVMTQQQNQQNQQKQLNNLKQRVVK